jgi:peptidoglycan/xylan/chitin deacetylase (PgdA/CDA1 family)
VGGAVRLRALLDDARLAVETRWLRGGAVGHGPRDVPHVALTFDDGPDPRWTPGILATLARHGARATFFCLGQALVDHPALAREVAAAHQVGTHLFTHTRGLTRDRSAFAAELERALAAHADVLGRRPEALRFPYGDSGVIRAADLRGLTAYHWSVSSLDSRAESPEAIVARLGRVGPGDIVLLHDGRGPGSTLGPGHREHTVAALDGVLRLLAARGLRAVTLDEMFRR